MVARGLTTETDLAATPLRRADRQGDHRLHTGVAFIEEIGHEGRIAIEAQGELGEVIGADREAIEAFSEGLGGDHIAGQFAHHEHLQAVLTAHQTLFRHQGQHLVPLLGGAAEGHHRDRVGQPHPLPHPFKGLTFQGESRGEGSGGVTGGAAPAQHRILLNRLKGCSAQKPGVFVALEIGETQNHRSGMERRRDAGHPLGQLVDVVLARILVAPDQSGDLLPLLLRTELLGMEQRQRMDADVVGDDELQPRQPDAVAGDGGQVEGLLRIAHIHQDAGAGGGQIAEGLLIEPEGQPSGVDMTHLPLTAGERHGGTVLKEAGAITTAHDGRDAHLAGDDRRMAGAAALVGHHAAGHAENRLPIRIGALSDKHITLLEMLHGGRIANQPHHSAAHGGADRLAAHDRARLVGLQMPTAQHRATAAGFHRLRAGLEDVELTIGAILGPLDVHRGRRATKRGVVGLDRHRPAGQGEHLLVAEGEALAIGRLHRLDAYRPACFRGIGTHQADRLAAQPATENRTETLGQSGLEDQPFIRIHRTLHHRLTQPVGGGEEHRIAKAGLGIDTEHHPRAGPICHHHALHPDREGHLEIVEALELAVGEGPVGEQRGIAAAAGLKQVRFPLDMQKGFLLACETGIRQILSGGAGAHGHGRSPQGAVSDADLLLQPLGQGGCQQQGSSRLARGLEGRQISRVEAFQDGAQGRLKAVAGEEKPVGGGGGGEPFRHAHPRGGQGADHLAEGGILAAHAGDRFQPHGGQRQHQGLIRGRSGAQGS